jgi:cellulose synthase/poly-beta-1,6-N-acetylglucosamine synthase-like glycosyltransferase
MLATKAAFWVFFFLVIYPYALYLPFLKFLANRKRSPVLDCYKEAWPDVTFIISAYNEEGVIAEKLENTLSLKYPVDKLEVVVVSDASSDYTDAIVREKSKQDNRIRLVRQNKRKGKTAGLNLTLEDARGEIVVFSDANAIYQENALNELVKFFINPQVGYVVGAALYSKTSKAAANICENTYWDQELALKQTESDFYSVVGGDGAIYAIRKELYQPLQEDDINDFVNPLQIVARGYRGVFNPKAICREDATYEFVKEYQRKRRIVNRSFRAFSRCIGEFNLMLHFKFLFMLFSHKVLRWFGFFFILGLVFTALILTMHGEGLIYSACLIGIALSGAFALIGWLLSGNSTCPKPLYLLYYFYMVNIAAMQGIIDNFRGRYHVTWNHVRK